MKIVLEHNARHFWTNWSDIIYLYADAHDLVHKQYLLWFPPQTVNYDRFEVINSHFYACILLYRSFQFKYIPIHQKIHWRIQSNKHHVLTNENQIFIYAHWKCFFEPHQSKPDQNKRSQNYTQTHTGTFICTHFNVKRMFKF